MSVIPELLALFAIPLWLGVFLGLRQRWRAAGTWTSVDRNIAIIAANVAVIGLNTVVIALTALVR